MLHMMVAFIEVVDSTDGKELKHLRLTSSIELIGLCNTGGMWEE